MAHPQISFFFLKPSSNWPNHCSHTVNEETTPKKKRKKRQLISSKWCNTLLLPKKRTHSTRIKVLTLHFAKYTFGRRNPTKKETPQFTKTTFFFLGKKKKEKKNKFNKIKKKNLRIFCDCLWIFPTCPPWKSQGKLLPSLLRQGKAVYWVVEKCGVEWWCCPRRRRRVLSLFISMSMIWHPWMAMPTGLALEFIILACKVWALSIWFMPFQFFFFGVFIFNGALGSVWKLRKWRKNEKLGLLMANWSFRL